MKTILKRGFSIILAYLLLRAGFIYQDHDSFMEKVHGDNTELHIKNEEDFIELAKNCELDSFSMGKTVILDRDLDFKDKDFSPIPIFYGNFEGNNHKIKGVKFYRAGSNIGLFRVNCGTVNRLVVSADIVPTESANGLGIIAGENQGRINSCTAQGGVKGKNNIGGIAGKNSLGATIWNCRNEAGLTGIVHVGGIAGFNLGMIDSCKNSAEINTSKDQVNNSKITNLSNIKVTLLNELNDEKYSSIDVYSCVGGIAGRNEGTLSKSKNLGDIGYPHLGYNVGGITGILNGIVKNCENYGTVDGRKDVGGIAGQFEPSISLSYSQDLSENLKDESQNLVNLFRNLNNMLNTTSQGNLDKGEEINESIKKIEKILKEGGTEINEFSKEKSDILHQAFSLISDTNKKLLEDYKTYSDLIIKDGGKLLSNINGIVKEINSTLQEANSFIDDSNETIKNARVELIKQRDRLLALEEDIIKINKLLSEKSETIGNQITVLNGILEALKEDIESNNIPRLAEDLKAMFESFSEILSDFNKITEILSKEMKEISSTAFDASRKALKQVEVINDSFHKSASGIVDANFNMSRYIKEYSRNIDENNKNLNENLSKLNDLINAYLKIDNEQIRIIEENTKEEFDYVNNQLHNRYDEVYKEAILLNDTLNEMIGFNKENSSQVNLLTEQIISKFNDISQTLSNMIKIPEYKSENLFDFDENNLYKGSIAFSNNDGLVRGDANVGGICGAVALELGNNPEDDFKLNKNRWRDTTAFMRAIIYKSNNNGTVESKTDYAGGIVGAAFTGVIDKSTNKGKIKGKNFLGGIAGYSEGDILDCDVLCDIEGENKLGGIGGVVSRIVGNRSMVRIKSEGEKLGAIAGEVRNESEIKNNVFVKEKIGAIDGISYAGLAYPLSYQDFINQEGLPDYYNTLYVRFIDGKKLLKSVKVEYNGSIKESEIPIEKFNEDGYSKWEDFTKSEITRSQDVHLKHSPWISTVSSKENVPLLLAEGKFFPKGEIRLTKFDIAFDKDKYKKVLGYKYEILGSYKHKNEKYKLRVRLNKGEELRILKDNKLKEFEYEMNGSYGVFEGNEDGEIVIVKPNPAQMFAFVLINGALILVVIIFAYLKLKKKTRIRLKKKGLI